MSTTCKGLLGECINCIWPACEHVSRETITIDHSEDYPYAYYGDDDGITSANNPAFWYALAMTKPHYPMPAIPLQVKYDYLGCVNIDDVTDVDDPRIVYMWDSWSQQNV